MEVIYRKISYTDLSRKVINRKFSNSFPVSYIKLKATEISFQTVDVKFPRKFDLSGSTRSLYAGIKNALPLALFLALVKNPSEEYSNFSSSSIFAFINASQENLPHIFTGTIRYEQTFLGMKEDSDTERLIIGVEGSSEEILWTCETILNNLPTIHKPHLILKVPNNL